jgi:tetraacyldisaccharide-1-P 4'-kinase
MKKRGQRLFPSGFLRTSGKSLVNVQIILKSNIQSKNKRFVNNHLQNITKNDPEQKTLGI